MKIIAIYTTLLFLKIVWIPNADLSFWLLMAMVFDFFTGYIKAWRIKEARTSSGIRKTVTKLIQYLGALVLVMLFQNALKEEAWSKLLDDGVIVFMIFAEIVSICENLMAIAPDSLVTKYLFKPLHALLTLAIEKKGAVVKNNQHDQSSR
ncbi:MAG: hypothetical protein EAY75_15045 [Bacteroidetes bacterium]|nr:MAG: hypothetical protein EAY75_15045 [Bacteroidota bacterium]